MPLLFKTIFAAVLFLSSVSVHAAPRDCPVEDGYDLWLRYRPVEDQALAEHYASVITGVNLPGESATLQATREELNRGLGGLLGEVQFVDDAGAGRVLLGTPASSDAIARLGWENALSEVGPEGYIIRNVSDGNGSRVVIAANEDVGVLYGAFHLLRLIQTHQRLENLDITESPAIEHRILNHWDNLDRTIERGYAGFSLWDWQKLPHYLDPRYTDYARANASIGINATVLTNVNANADILRPQFLEKVAALADVFRPYGITVYLTARFSAPMELDGLPTADPLNAEVQAWWADKVTEIYSYVPDFGGFLVKANSEGQPGPQDYDRSHAEGANMLADAVAPHGGIVMWRAFVYSDEEPVDRAKQAYNEFVPLEGQFRDNVLVQVKNGPIDFQPREPFHPLFGAMPETPLMMEFQITQEYLGHGTHLAYLAPLFEEVLRADTYAEGPGSTVARVVDGSLHGYPVTAMAGVANTGNDRNWTSHHFSQANWYAFGRLAWDPNMTSEAIADEWIPMTFTNDPSFVAPVKDMMMKSREAVVDYMTPLGLHHLMAESHHYGPGPWVSDRPRADWTAVYYHRADSEGIGFDRSATGSNAVGQYFSPVREKYGDVDTVPEELLLWFHRVPWTHQMESGRNLWNELVYRYNRGVETVRSMQRTWDAMEGKVDERRFNDVRDFLAIQEREARWWRDASLAYFQTFSNMPIPDEYEQPEHPLEYYMNIQSLYVPGI